MAIGQPGRGCRIAARTSTHRLKDVHLHTLVPRKLPTPSLRPGQATTAMKALLLMALARANEPSIKAITPINNGEVTLQDGALVMAYSVSDATSDLRLCAQLTNKRVSFESHTHCVDARAPVTSFKLGGFLPGVWRCRAVLRRGADPPTLHRGAAPLMGVVSNVEESWFLVERESWLNDITGNGPNVTATRRVLALASSDDTLRKALRDTAVDNMLVVTMANLPHADLALNLAFSAARVGAPLFAFALSEATYDKLRTHNVACGKLPTLFGGVDGRRDVQSAGFSEIAILKPIAVAVALRASIQVVWWIDTDVVLLRDLPSSRAVFAIQAGGLHARDYALGEDQFHAEQCTGVFRVTQAAEMLMVQSALELATIRDKHPERTWAGDQAATNLVLHERRFREGTNISVEVFDALEVPGGGLFFEGPLDEDRGPLIRANPILAHNNFIVGKDKKLERFRKHGMWFSDFNGAFDDALRHRAPLNSCSTIEVMGITPEVRSIDDVLFVEGRTVLHLHASCALKDRVVAVASLGDRPWVSTLIKRVAQYAIKIDADLLVAGDASRCYTREEGDNGCAKAFKLIVLRSALRKYRRVLVLDDTVVVRRDAPDVFDLVPTVALGATVEDPLVRSPSEAKQSLEISCLRYGVPCNTEEAWFNSGVLVASWPQLGLVETLPPWDSFERVLHWDQGYLNAMRLKYGVPLVDLGYAFNWVGSFHSTNAENAPFSAFDAYFVHGTTGLFLPHLERGEYLVNVSRAWDLVGL